MNEESSCVVEEALVSGNNPIPDGQITASSVYDIALSPAHYARINNTAGWGAWLPSVTEIEVPELRMYLQVCSLLPITALPFSMHP